MHHFLGGDFFYTSQESTIWTSRDPAGTCIMGVQGKLWEGEIVCFMQCTKQCLVQSLVTWLVPNKHLWTRMNCVWHSIWAA